MSAFIATVPTASDSKMVYFASLEGSGVFTDPGVPRKLTSAKVVAQSSTREVFVARPPDMKNTSVEV